VTMVLGATVRYQRTRSTLSSCALQRGLPVILVARALVPRNTNTAGYPDAADRMVALVAGRVLRVSGGRVLIPGFRASGAAATPGVAPAPSAWRRLGHRLERPLQRLGL